MYTLQIIKELYVCFVLYLIEICKETWYEIIVKVRLKGTKGKTVVLFKASIKDFLLDLFPSGVKC